MGSIVAALPEFFPFLCPSVSAFFLRLVCWNGLTEALLILTAGEKGVSSWLTADPVTSNGTILNKSDFRDAACLRYGFRWMVSQSAAYVERKCL